jgi:hypothetical protein
MLFKEGEKGRRSLCFKGAFFYYKKDLCHIWKDKTAKEKKAVTKDLKA